MQVKFLLQPCSEEQRIGAAINECSDATALWALVAWAQESGLDHLEPFIQSIRQRGGISQAILGVDQGIATVEGLRSALDLFDIAYIFHDERRSFHPKLYLVDRGRETRVVVGSGNLTEGGLYGNYEVAAAIDLSSRRADDRGALRDIRAHFQSFITSPAPFRQLDEQLLAELLRSGVIARSAAQGSANRAKQTRIRRALAPIFGRGRAGLPAPPPRTRRRRPSTRPGSPSSTTRPTTQAAGPTGVAISWWKQLTPSDAMRKPSTSHQRNYVILGQARHPIRQATFFRKHLFAGVSWAKQPMHTGRVKEVAVVTFDVFVDGRALGTQSFRIDHNEQRIANQGNSPTWLNWSGFSSEVRRRNFTNRYLLLERLNSGDFRMTITRQQPSPAVIPPRARRN